VIGMTHLAAVDVVTAALHLMRAGHWSAATRLLDAAQTDDPAERQALAIARAEVAVDQDFAQQTDHAEAALAAVDECWDAQFLGLRKDYATALFASGSGASGLDDRARRLGEEAPDDGRRGAVSFYSGLIADNLMSRPDEAFGHYTASLELAEKADDRLLASYPLRHLGDHAHTAGNLALAREHWERSVGLRQQAGQVFGALAQQALLAELLRDEGDEAGSLVLATEVNRWARQLDLPYLVRQTESLIAQVG
jgi:tetratricopeptide (TPR) repeat protein